jgi:predicted RNase H-like HicB family nuclease
MTKSDLPEKFSYHLVFEPEPEGGFTVTVPALSGCITYGATFEEATANAREAILLCLEDMFARGEDIPTESRAPIVSSIEFTPVELHG